MTRQLLVLRHGKSDWQGSGASDFDRPLARRGSEDAPRLGQWLADRGLTPDYLLSSPATRARQTAEAVAAALDLPVTAIHYDPRLYLAERISLLEVLSECPPTARRVLLIGHNPGLEVLLEYLADAAPPRDDQGKLMTTASLACLETENDWRALQQGGARLVELVRPADLKNRP